MRVNALRVHGVLLGAASDGYHMHDEPSAPYTALHDHALLETHAEPLITHYCDLQLRLYAGGVGVWVVTALTLFIVGRDPCSNWTVSELGALLCALLPASAHSLYSGSTPVRSFAQLVRQPAYAW